jgi:hypothetical protein
MELWILVEATHTRRTHPRPHHYLLRQIREIKIHAWKESKRRNHELRHLIRSKTRSAYDIYASSLRHKKQHTVVILIWSVPSTTLLTHSRHCFDGSYGAMLRSLLMSTKHAHPFIMFMLLFALSKTSVSFSTTCLLFIPVVVIPLQNSLFTASLELRVHATLLMKVEM